MSYRKSDDNCLWARVSVMWQESQLSADRWADLWQSNPMPLQQSAIYGAAIAEYGATPLRLIYGSARNPAACVQIIERKAFGIFTAAVAFMGPQWRLKSMLFEDKVAALKALQARYPKLRLRFLSLMPAERDTDEDCAKLMKKIGARQTITGYPTIWLNLDRDLEIIRQELKGKWRNSLVTAEKMTLDVQIGGKKPSHYGWLLAREDAQRLIVRYSALPTQLVEQYADAARRSLKHSVLTVTALETDKKIAGQLFLIHGNSATYYIGWNGRFGRRASAHNLLTWQAIVELKQRGIKWLDLGGVNTEEGAGIARFKLGLGAPPYIYAGTFI